MSCKVIKSRDAVGVTCFERWQMPDVDSYLTTSGRQLPNRPRSEAHGETMTPEELALKEEAAYQRGFRDAETQLQEKLTSLSQSTAAALEKSIHKLDQFQRRLIGESEKQVAKLALEIAKKIVRREVRIDNQIITAMIKVALSYVGDAKKLKIRVNPEDLPVIRKSLPDLKSYDSDSRATELIGDPAIERGGFVIESDAGMVDARLGQQFQEIEKNFFGQEHV